ncbi:FAD-dependent thymidylate synthase [Streptomyces prunicolor]|uniref:FAD-dependent thymidylate synthase n=1 Tax=Streptomyces prunicolor TaxID=67348 RepID=UPI0033DBCCC6
MTVDVVAHNASDWAVARAAWVSTLGASSAGIEKPTEGLINFLMRDRHGSPFEHSFFTFYIEAPIFVVREFFRHRAGWSYNEESGRYKELRPVFYIPHKARPLVQVGKAGAYEFKAGNALQQSVAEVQLSHAYEEAFESYQCMLNHGIAREVARMALPVGIYTSFYATCNARSLMHFLSLRTKSENAAYPSFPQREIEMVAEKMESALDFLMPETYAAFEKHGRVAP